MAYILGRGAKFNWHNGTSAVAVVQAEEITPAGSTVPPIKFKATDGTGEVLVGGGLEENGDVQFTIAWDPDDTVHALLYSDHLAQNTRACNVTYDATVGSGAVKAWTTGLISGWEEQGFTADDLQKVQVTVAVSGPSITP